MSFSWGEAVLWWLPLGAVVAMFGLALAAVLDLGPRLTRSHRLAIVGGAGAVAIALTAWQQATSYAALSEQGAQLHDLATRVGQLGASLSNGAVAGPDESFDTVATVFATLNSRIKDLEEQVQGLRDKAKARSIDKDAAGEMADYLRPLGKQRVVVSCVPEDVEAFRYASQIANVLRAAGWEAAGPETTMIFGEGAAMAVTLYVRNGSSPEAARVLVEAFQRFNIPLRSGITPTDAIPDPATVELFVGHKS